MKTLMIVLLTAVNAFAERPLRGVYEVPTGDELKPFSTFEVRLDGNGYESFPYAFDLPLPKELVGEEMFIHLRKTSLDGNEWSGPKASGTCDYSDRQFQCNLRFNDLKIDPKKVEAAIDEKFATPEEKQGRLKVATLFSTEPIGIITYRLRGHDRK